MQFTALAHRDWRRGVQWAVRLTLGGSSGDVYVQELDRFALAAPGRSSTVTSLKLYLDAQTAADPWSLMPVSLVVGLLAVSALVRIFGVDLHVAEGTSLLIFLPPNSVSGAVHLHRGTADLSANASSASVPYPEPWRASC